VIAGSLGLLPGWALWFPGLPCSFACWLARLDGLLELLAGWLSVFLGFLAFPLFGLLVRWNAGFPALQSGIPSGLLAFLAGCLGSLGWLGLLDMLCFLAGILAGWARCLLSLAGWACRLAGFLGLLDC
jgi:hypothetical protein